MGIHWRKELLYRAHYALLSNVRKEVNHDEVPIPLLLLIEKEIQANRQRRKHAKDYVQLFLKTDKCEPNDVDMKYYLDLQDQPNVMEYDWVDIKINVTSSFLSIKVAIYADGIMVSDPLEWLALLV